MSMTDVKKISLRFHMDRERDKKAYTRLEKLAEQMNCSYNEVLLEMLSRYENERGDTSELAESIADIVALRIEKLIPEIGKVGIQAPETEDIKVDEDSPVLVGEDALSFLSGF